MAGRGIMIYSGAFAGLVPTVDELIKLIADICFRGVADNWRTGTVPCVVNVDAIEAIPSLTAHLASAGISVIYYPPPSSAENEINHPQKPLGQKVCDYCQQPAADGVKLLRCGRCPATYYCSVEHQRAGWKTHKPVCGQ
jgi:hypothetical protein